MANVRGLVMVFTGNGKGKTTAALGMALRAWGQGLKILIIQFIKGDQTYGELFAAQRMEGLEIRPRGEGFIRGGNLEPHRLAAKKALEEAERELKSGQWDMIVVDEIIYALGFELVTQEDVLKLITAKPPETHLVLTGRNVPQSIIDQADLVTEMKEIKHPFAQGITAQKGVEF